MLSIEKLPDWRILAALGTLACFVLSYILPDWAIFMGTLILAKSLVVLGLSVLWRGGLISFGHGLFFGLGAYTTGMVGHYFNTHDFMIMVISGGFIAMLVAFILGFLLSRYRGIFFANLILAFSMLLYGLIAKNEELGSTDGMHITPPTFLGMVVDEGSRMPILFVFSAAVAFFLFGLIHKITQTTLGQMATAMRDNETRVEYLGFSVRRAYHALLVISAGLAGVGGAITAQAVGHIDPEMTFWTTSGEFLFITILSGTGSVVAPLLGTFVFEFIRTYALEYSPSTWQIILGGSLLLCILFLPNGLWSLLQKKSAKKERAND